MLEQDDVLSGSSKASKKWKTVTAAILTASQLLFFRDRNVFVTIENYRHSGSEEVLDFVFQPDEVVSLQDAFAMSADYQVREFHRMVVADG
jgi:hypothetical protein